MVILDALSDLEDDVGILITKANADDGGRLLNQEIKNTPPITKMQNPMMHLDNIFTITASIF